MNRPPRECPHIIYWLTRTGVCLTSLPKAEGVHRRVSKPFVPYAAVSFAWVHGDWRPLTEVPASWGLKPLDGLPSHLYESDEEGGEPDEDG